MFKALFWGLFRSVLKGPLSHRNRD